MHLTVGETSYRPLNVPFWVIERAVHSLVLKSTRVLFTNGQLSKQRLNHVKQNHRVANHVCPDIKVTSIKIISKPHVVSAIPHPLPSTQAPQRHTVYIELATLHSTDQSFFTIQRLRVVADWFDRWLRRCFELFCLTLWCGTRMPSVPYAYRLIGLLRWSVRFTAGSYAIYHGAS